MGLKSIFARPFAKYVTRQVMDYSRDALNYQDKVFKNLIRTSRFTSFGRDHHFERISDYSDFKARVPIRDYEGLRPYIERIIKGEEDVLWIDKPIYFAKTSGTTSGSKYIPITKASISNHINSARNALLANIYANQDASFVDGKMIFLSGSPQLDFSGGIPTGRLSGIVNHHIPAYLRRNQLPSYTTNCMEDWELKLDAIVEETINEDMTLISGIPPWMQMYFDRLIEIKRQPIKQIFPNLKIIVHGGVNFKPYQARMQESIGGGVDYIETFPASEGFFAYSDSLNHEGLLLNVNSGIFFEFVPADELFNEHPTRLSLREVELGVNYALIINSNAGLWGYNIGDTIKFVSKNPYRIVVSGRVKHFISAFGEHVIAEEVEKTIFKAIQSHSAVVSEFTVAPQVEATADLPHHQWLIEFEQEPADMDAFAKEMDEELCSLNSYYNDLIEGKILRPLVVSSLKKNSFQDYMKSQGKLGGQNKVPRLSNDRKIADDLMKYSKIGQ